MNNVVDFNSFKKAKEDKIKAKNEILAKVNPNIQLIELMTKQLELVGRAQAQLEEVKDRLHTESIRLQLLAIQLRNEQDKMVVANRLTNLLMEKYGKNPPSHEEQAFINALYTEADTPSKLERMKKLILELESTK